MKRFLKRFLVVVLVIVGLLAVIIYGGRAYLGQVGSRELAVVRDRLNTSEPGWTLEAIETARQQAAPPAGQNSAQIVLRVADLIGTDQVGNERHKAWSTWRSSEEWSNRFLTPHLPSAKFVEGMNKFKEPTAEARQLARNISRFPAGYYPLTIDKNPYVTLLPHVQKAREVAALLEYDALLAAIEKDPDAALVAALATFNAGRSIGDEPTLISQLVRLACCRIATQTTAQILAWGEPKRGLAELQAAFRAEADVPWVQYGLRGERASLDRVFSGLESGALSVDDLARLWTSQPTVLHHTAFHLYKGFLPGDHAKALEILTAYIEAMKLPYHDQQAALAAIPIPPGPPDEFRYIITRLLIPACNKVADAALRTRAEHLCMSVAIACERFRQASGRWPDHLAAIPGDILPEIPLDPYTGQPLQYLKFKDGIAVFSVGDRNADTNRRHQKDKDPLAGLGLGCRLWNPENRGQPALPEEEPKQP